MPDAAAECGDVDLGRVIGVEENAVAPLEVVALDACPVRAAVGGAVGSGVKPGEIERIGMAGIDGQVVDVLRLRKEGSPRPASIIGDIDAAVPVGDFPLLSPCRQVEAQRVAWVDL